MDRTVPPPGIKMGGKNASVIESGHDDGPLIPARHVWERYGVTSMSLHRWCRDPKLGFPPPFYIGRFRYWKLHELLAWERDRPRRNPQHEVD